MILIQNTLCQIQRISPCGPLAFRSVCALKKKVQCSYAALATNEQSKSKVLFHKLIFIFLDFSQVFAFL